MPPQQPMIHESDYSDSSSLAVSSSPTKPVMNQRVSKRFHFALSRNEIFPIIHIDDMSDEEVRDIWYERGDYERMKMSMIPIIRKIMKGERIEENNRQTIRGLEYRTREGAIRRQHNKVEAISAVLDEQDRQLEFAGYLNDELLSKVYRQVSHHCQIEAHKLALSDVKPAQAHLADISMSILREQHHREAVDYTRLPPERKSSFGKLFRQMRLGSRRRLDTEPRGEDRPPVLPSSRPVVGSAA